MKIEFVNHASVKVYTPDAVILSDPWYDGSVFNDGWDLLVSGPDDLKALLSDVTHIWVSHEHPDHFSPAFFSRISDEQKGNLTVLFQETRDRRVASFLEKKGFRLEEMQDGKTLKLGQYTDLVCGKSGFYDSYLYVSDGEKSLMNLNDCPMSDTSELLKLKDKVGAVDVLLTQFSYAAWKGGRENQAFRDEAARDKLATMATQATALGANAIIPFASYVFFSNEENDYLNRGINTPDDVIADHARHGAEIVVMQPGERWEVGAAHDNEPALAFWRGQYETVPSRDRRAPLASVSVEDLKSAFEAYREQVFKDNSYSIAFLARHNPVLRGFLPVRILLTDLDQIIEVSVMDGFKVVHGDHDVSMHSSSLKFIFDNSFGFDTLTVNGRFEASADGFSKLTRSFAIGSLNGMGITLGYATIFRADLILKLLSLLFRVQKRLKPPSS